MKRSRHALLLLTAALLVLAAADLLAGGVRLTPAQVWEGLQGQGAAADIVRGIRIPRLLTALVAGAALALSGAQLQAVFRNDLADPHILGVSGGAGLGAAIATVALGASLPGIASAAFLGALGASGLIALAAGRFRGGATLLIFGVMLGFIFSALSSVIAYSAREESLKLFYSWSAGSFQGAGAKDALLMGGALLAGLGLALHNAKGLDLLLFGEEYAKWVGAPVRRIRLQAILGCCLMTGTVTAFCGPLGFVGIIAPHFARWLSGTAVHRQILPASLLTGSVLTLAADLLSQLAPHPLPAGSTLALLGIPVILVLLLRKR